jgi:two-component sensor histidine kinase
MRWRDNFDLPRQFERIAPPIVTQALVALGMVLLAVGVRLMLQRAFGNVVPFALLFPAVIGAALLAGPRSGLMVIVLGQTAAWYFLLPVKNSFQFATAGDAVSLVLTTVAELLLLWSVCGYRNAVRATLDTQAGRSAALESQVEALAAQARIDAQLRANEQSLQQTRQNLMAIYNASADGLTLCRAVRDADGQVIDYQVLEVNKAHAALTGATRERMLASLVSQIAPPVNPRWFTSADTALKTGKMQQFDVQSPVTGRWLNIRVSPVSDDLFQQTFVDVTDRHLLDEQRQHLLKEMNHRVANNLQMISSFLHLQSGMAEPSAGAQLKAAQGRVQVLAQLHSLLAYTESDREVDVSAYIGQLCEQLTEIIDRAGEVELQCACEPLLLTAEKVVPIGLIISELVTNAAKYAFPAPVKGVIQVSLTSDGHRWVLMIHDNGRGMSAASQDERTGGAMGGLGTKLVRQFVRQLGGSMTTTSDGGVRHEIIFELFQAKAENSVALEAAAAARL